MQDQTNVDRSDASRAVNAFSGLCISYRRDNDEAYYRGRGVCLLLCYAQPPQCGVSNHLFSSETRRKRSFDCASLRSDDSEGELPGSGPPRASAASDRSAYRRQKEPSPFRFRLMAKAPYPNVPSSSPHTAFQPVRGPHKARRRARSTLSSSPRKGLWPLWGPQNRSYNSGEPRRQKPSPRRGKVGGLTEIVSSPG